MPKGPKIRDLDPKDQILTNIIIDDDEGCWIWTRAIETSGYGVICIEGRSVMRRAHRYSYEVFVGPIPEGLFLDHLCMNPKCVNPEHLEPVSALENVRRARAARGLDLHCPQGHPRSEENTRIYISKKGHRNVRCRPCERERRARKREEES